MSTRIPAPLPFVLALLAACNGAVEEDTLSPSTSTLNTGCAVAGNFPNGMASVGPYLFFLVNESEQGEVDLNGDADVADDVVHVLDTTSNTVTNLEMSALHNFASDGTTMGWVVAESDEGEDLNGDSDFSDHFLAVFDPASAPGANNPRVVGTSLAPGTGIHQWVPIQAEDGYYVYAELEALMAANSTTPSSADLNGDFTDDTNQFLDLYLTVYDVESDSFFRTGIASNSTDVAFLLRNGVLAFTVAEGENGAATDLNGDADFDDIGLAYHEVGSGTVQFTGRSVHPTGFTIGGTPAAPKLAYAVDETADEPSEGDSLNASGPKADFDLDDFVLAVWSVGPDTETLPGNGIAVQPTRLSASEERLSFVAVEEDNGLAPADFNVDGDSEDVVPFWVDLNAPFVANAVGIATDGSETSPYPIVTDEFMLMFASEADQGPAGTNYNPNILDTDAEDMVAFFVDIAQSGTTRLTNLGLAGTQLIPSTEEDPSWFFVTASESSNESTDLNQDGDTVDQVFAYFPVSAGGQVDTTLRVGRYGGTSTSVFVDLPNAVGIVSFTEEGTGLFSQDLNKDLDSNDVVATVQLVSKSNHVFGDEKVLGTVLTTVQAEDAGGDDEESETSNGISIFPFLIDGTTFAFPALESAIGEGVDHNGDGDRDDSVLFCFELGG